MARLGRRISHLCQSLMRPGNQCLTGWRRTSRGIKTGTARRGSFFGMRQSAAACAIRWMIAVFICALAAPAVAQDAPNAAYVNASPPSNPTDEAASQADTPLTADEAAALDNALTFDSMNLSDAKPKSLRLPNFADPNKFGVSHADKPDGSRTVVLKQPLSASEWDAKVGADLTLAGT